MPSTEHFLGFALLTLVLVAIPGPSVLFTLSRALNLGRRAALLSVLGNALGVYLQVIAVAVGLGVLLTSSITAFTIVKLAGGAYLVFLGVQAIRHRRVQPSTEPDPATTRSSRVLREGLVVGATNPKMLVFLAAHCRSSRIAARRMPRFICSSSGCWCLSSRCPRTSFGR